MLNDYIFCLFVIQYDDFEDSDGVTSEGKNFLCPGQTNTAPEVPKLPHQ